MLSNLCAHLGKHQKALITLRARDALRRTTSFMQLMPYLTKTRVASAWLECIVQAMFFFSFLHVECDLLKLLATKACLWTALFSTFHAWLVWFSARRMKSSWNAFSSYLLCKAGWYTLHNFPCIVFRYKALKIYPSKYLLQNRLKCPLPLAWLSWLILTQQFDVSFEDFSRADARYCQPLQKQSTKRKNRHNEFHRQNQICSVGMSINIDRQHAKRQIENSIKQSRRYVATHKQ